MSSPGKPPHSADDALNARVAQNLAAVRAQIRTACQAAGRQPDDVTLVGVTKYVGLAAIRALLRAGQRDLGESRVQQLMPRVAALATPTPAAASPSTNDLPQPTWHLIGHLQRNKVKYLLPDVRIIHSVDSQRLAEQISQLAQKTAENGKSGCRVEIFIEVNTSGEAAKHGVAPEQLEPLLAQIAALPQVTPVGLMTMAPRVDDPIDARRYFAKLRALLEHARESGIVPESCRYLSMGMSGDFEAAIAEGATHVRIGSALFDGLTEAEQVQN